MNTYSATTPHALAPRRSPRRRRSGRLFLATFLLASIGWMAPAQGAAPETDCVTVALGDGFGPTVWANGSWDLWVLDTDTASFGFVTPLAGTPLTTGNGADIVRIHKCNDPEPTPSPSPTVEPTSEPTPEATTEPTEDPTPPAEPTPEPTTEPTADPTPQATVEPTPEPTTEPTTDPTPQATVEPTPEATTEPTADPTPQSIVEPTPEPTSRPTAEPTPTPAQASTQSTPTPSPAPEVLSPGDEPAEPFTTEDAEVLGETLANTGPSHLSTTLLVAGLLLGVGALALGLRLTVHPTP